MNIDTKFVPIKNSVYLNSYKKGKENVIIISPHPDDDVIGIGGLMCILSQKGKNIFSVYLTNGSICQDPKMGEIRRNEAIEALRIIKAKGAIFLDHCSASIFSKEKVIKNEIKEIMEYFYPEQVFIPTCLERHKTHLFASVLTIKVLKEIDSFCPKLFGYNVWGGWIGLKNQKVIDISDVVKIKQQAIEAHQSQLKKKAFSQATLARNLYEAVFLDPYNPDKERYVEILLDLQELIINKELEIKKFFNDLIVYYLNEVFTPLS